MTTPNNTKALRSTRSPGILQGHVDQLNPAGKAAPVLPYGARVATPAAAPLVASIMPTPKLPLGGDDGDCGVTLVEDEAGTEFNLCDDEPTSDFPSSAGETDSAVSGSSGGTTCDDGGCAYVDVGFRWHLLPAKSEYRPPRGADTTPTRSLSEPTALPILMRAPPPGHGGVYLALDVAAKVYSMQSETPQAPMQRIKFRLFKMMSNENDKTMASCGDNITNYY